MLICLILIDLSALLSHDLFSLANAWEEEDEVVLITCRLENLDLDMVSGAVKEKVENFPNELCETWLYL